jgi:aminoglycoside phosphotransferase (APT) family kinase protein
MRRGDTVPMRQDRLLVRLTEHLGLRDASPLSGGEFGAVLVRDAGGRELILKALPSPAFAARFARGARMAMRLRERGYPAPEYMGTGVALGASWSLQERLPGAIPETPTSAHIAALLALAERHVGAAGEQHDARAYTQKDIAGKLASVAADGRTAPLAADIAAVLRATEDIRLLDNCVVHGDFHHRNFLAVGDKITGVFDWEGARPGDWRADVAKLAFWCALLPDQIPPDAGAIAIERVHELCERRVLAFFAAAMAAGQLDYDLRAHPDRLDAITSGIDNVIAPWWRAALR